MISHRRKCFLALLLATFAVPLQAQEFHSPDEESLIKLAHASIAAEVQGSKPPVPTSHTPTSPVFVTIERKGVVLGCRGDLTARKSSLEQEVIAAARGAAVHDPRYKPIRAEDLNTILVTVTIVRRQESISSIQDLSPADGLILVSGTHTGIVLPWEGKDPKIRLLWAYRKANVTPGSPCQLYRLIADRFRG